MTTEVATGSMAGITSARFRAIGCDHEILTTDAGSSAEALRIAQELLDELDLAASRFRPDSQVSRIAEAARHTQVTTTVGPLLTSCLVAALHAARITDGLVDPTVGRAVAASGYDADLGAVRARAGHQPDEPKEPDEPDVHAKPAPRVQRRHSDGHSPVNVPSSGLVPAVVPSDGPARRVTWRDVHLEPREGGTGRLEVAAGTLLDLGATAKAHAADLLAARLAAALPGGFLVNLGGDIAVGGDLPDGGWEIGVEAAEGSTLQVIVSTGQAVTTSSTQVRTWRRDGEERHHIVDPRTGRTAPVTWAQVTCVGATCLEANAASTAAIVLGADAPAWLTAHGIPARLDGLDGSVVLTPGWPAPVTHAG